MGKIHANEPIIFWFNNKPKAFWFGKRERKKIILLTVVLAIVIFSALFWLLRPKIISGRYIYNEGEIGIVASYLDEPIGSFQEMWSKEEALTILPESFPEEMDVLVFPRFTADGHFVDLQMKVTTTNSQIPIFMESHSFNEFICEDPTLTTTPIGQVMFTLCRGPMFMSIDNKRIALGATATIDQVDWFFYMKGTHEEIKEMKAAFEALLDSFGDDPIDQKCVCDLKPKGLKAPVDNSMEMSRNLG